MTQLLNTAQWMSRKSKRALRLCAIITGISLSGCAAATHDLSGGSDGSQAMAQDNRQEERDERLAVLGELADRLEMAYLFPEYGAAYAGHLRSRTFTPEDAALSNEAFATLITGELLAIHQDGHLRLEVREEGQVQPGHPHPAPPPANVITHVADGVAYLRIDALWGSDPVMAQLESLVSSMSSSNPLIIDLRENRGGGLREMDFLFSELFADPTDLVVMEMRRPIYDIEGAPFGENPAMQVVDAPDGLVRLLHRAVPTDQPRLTQARVFILTSPTTGSAGEHLTMALQRTGRATVIGEPSRGAAHFGGLMPIGDHFSAFIPAGRTFDPDTGLSWEGTGNTPDIPIDAGEALSRALSLSGLNSAEAEAFTRGLQ